MQNLTLAQILKDLFFGQPGNPRSIKNGNTNPPDEADIKEILHSSSKPYKVLTGLLTGHATTPTFLVLENETGASISSISRNGAGDYDINISTNGFTSSKTMILGNAQGGNYIVQGARKDANSVTVKILSVTAAVPTITDPSITVTQGDPVSAVIADPAITGGVPSFAGSDSGVAFVEIRIYD